MGNNLRPPLYSFSLVPLKALAILTLVLLGANRGWTAQSSDPLARVNGTTIYRSDLSCAVEVSLARKHSLRNNNGEGNEDNRHEIDHQKTLERLIDIELLYQESLKHRFHGLMEESEERYKLEVRRLGGEERLLSALQCNEITPEQFRKTIFRNLSIKRLLNKVVYSKIEITEDQAREYYERNKDRFQKPESIRVRQILIRAPSEPGGDEKWREAEKKAFTIYEDASSGSDFVRLARRHSEDPVTASAGGDLGFIQRGNLNGFLDSLIFNLNEGTVTEPIRSRQGYHIIKVVSVNPAATKTFEEVKPHITTLLRREKAREMTTELINQLKSKAKIEIID